MDKRTVILLLTILVMGLVWSVIVPIWHTPDEQAHFGQVAFMAEKGRAPKDNDSVDLTEEIYQSEIWLGTSRDNLGNNKFTFHPEYKIEYTNSTVGKYEASISALNNQISKKNFIHKEATRYPISYYIPASLIYNLFYNADLFVRVYAVRAWSLGLFLSTIFITYRMGKLIFSNSLLFTYTILLMVGFQPMMVFANIGVNNDSLANFLFVAFIYLCSLFIIKGLSLSRLLVIFVITMLSLNTKPQFVIMVPVLTVLLIFVLSRDLKLGRKNIFSLLILAILLLIFLGLSDSSAFIVVKNVLKIINIPSYLKFTKEYTISHTISEVLPWYWGVYKWLGVTYPRVVHRVINRVLLIALIGFLIYLIGVLKNKLWKERRIQAILFLSFISVIFFLGVTYYDWYSWYTGGYQLGVQGRYFFPLISVQMMILLIGWQKLFPILKTLMVKALGFFMIILNMIGIYTVSNTYYDISSLPTLFKQVSQYKPIFFKGWNFVLIISIYFVLITILLFYYFRLQDDKKN